MANTYSNIYPTLFAQALQVLRESCLMPRLVNTDFADVPVGQGDYVNVAIASAGTVTDVAPTAAPQAVTDEVAVKVPIQLNKWRKTGFYYTDKEAGELGSGLRVRQMEERVRALANDINAFILAQYVGVYGITGTAGTTPFQSDLTAARGARLLLNKQLAPFAGRKVVLDPDAESYASVLAQFLAADQRGDQGGIIEGQIGRKIGMDWFMDHQVPLHTSTALTAGALTINGVQAAGAGSTDNGRTGTISFAKATNAAPVVAGDILEFTVGGVVQQHVVVTGVSLAVGNTTVTVAPALRVATAGAEAVTLRATHRVNLAFHTDAFAFASRRLTSNVESAARDSMTIADPVSRVVLRMEAIRQNKQDYIEFDVLYGAKCVRPELAARIAG